MAAFVREFIIPFAGVKRKVIYHFSDVHLAEYDELSDERETEEAKRLAKLWEQLRVGFATEHGEPCGEAQRKSAKEQFESLVQTAADGDAVLLAGDILDCVSGANCRLTERLLGDLSAPFLYVCGNHDVDAPSTGVFAALKNPVQVVDLGDVLLVGVDNARMTVTKEQNDRLESLLQGEKPLMIVMHVPVMTEGNRAEFEKIGENFRLNYPNAPEQTVRFLELIGRYRQRIVAVCAGHLHFFNESEIAPGVKQFVTSQGIAGNIHKYIVGENA